MSVEDPIIAILGGTGKEGTGLALRWARAGYTVLIGSRQAEKAKLTAEKVNKQIGNQIATGMTNHDAASQADICVLTVIHNAHRETIESVKDALGGKILVDATSRVDYLDPRPPDPPCAAEEAQVILGPAVKVVSAFQNIPAKSLRTDIHLPMNADALICSDDSSAAQRVVKLAEAAGMHGYYAGPLINANVVEGITSLLISMNKYYKQNDVSIRVAGIAERR